MDDRSASWFNPRFDGRARPNSLGVTPAVGIPPTLVCAEPKILPHVVVASVVSRKMYATLVGEGAGEGAGTSSRSVYGSGAEVQAG